MEYQMAQETWRDAETVSLFGDDGTFLVEFPLTFVRLGGQNSWRYILDVTLCVLDPVEEPRIVDENGDVLEEDASPLAGEFILVARTPISFARGPEYFRRNLPAVTDAGQSTRSRSKSRSTPNQSNFRFFVSVRDSQCLVTGAEAENCTAAHIVPQSRPDLYQKILRLRRNPPMFSPSSGILLEDALHRAWDRLQLSFFYRDNVYYVHFFDKDLPGADDYHGKAITPDRFHTRPSKHPDYRLIEWHYQQCAMARLRGFAVKMEVPPTSIAAMASYET